MTNTGHPQVHSPPPPRSTGYVRATVKVVIVSIHFSILVTCQAPPVVLRGALQRMLLAWLCPGSIQPTCDNDLPLDRGSAEQTTANGPQQVSVEAAAKPISCALCAFCGGPHQSRDTVRRCTRTVSTLDRKRTEQVARNAVWISVRMHAHRRTVFRGGRARQPVLEMIGDGVCCREGAGLSSGVNHLITSA